MADSEPGGHQSGARVLVVDDDATIRLLCTRVLKEAGYEVLEAEGSPEAMALLVESNEPIDLVLVDLFLPPPGFQLASEKTQYRRVNGHEMVAQMLTMKKQLRVVYMSSQSKSGLASQEIALGDTPFLQKPLSKDALLDQVSAAIAGPPLVFHECPDGKKSDVRWVD